MDRDETYNKLLLLSCFSCGMVHTVPFFLIFLVGQAGLSNAALWGLSTGLLVFLYRYQEGPLAEALHQNVDLHIDDFMFEMEANENRKALEKVHAEFKRVMRRQKWITFKVSHGLMSEEAFIAKSEEECLQRMDELKIKLESLKKEKERLKGDRRWKSK